MVAIMEITLPILLLILISQVNCQIINEIGSQTYVGFVVEGQVFCQDCSDSWSLTAAKPLPKVRLEVKCHDYSGKEVFNLAMRTNRLGWFYEPLKGLDLRSYHMDTFPHFCKVRLLHSIHRNCNAVTNVNYGITGAPLRYEKTLFNGTRYEADLYSTGPMAFRPRHCRDRTVRWRMLTIYCLISIQNDQLILYYCLITLFKKRFYWEPVLYEN